MRIISLIIMVAPLILLAYTSYISLGAMVSYQEQHRQYATQFLGTEEGAFAVRGYVDCVSSGGGLFAPSPTSAECVNVVLEAAAKLKGEQFARSAARSLGAYLDGRESLR